MAGLKVYCFLCMILSVTSSYVMASRSSKAIKGIYWPSWANSYLPPSAIDTRHFSHIYYAFLAPNNVTFKFDIPDSTARLLGDFTSTLHSKNPPVKTLYSVGGAGAGSALFASMASSATTRKSFIDSSIEVARKFGFDGIDLDWEFPRNPKEMDDLGLLWDEWRAAVREEVRAISQAPLLLTAAVYFSANFLLGDGRSFPIASINRNLDWINAMCYDYHGSWEPNMTGAHAALYDPKSNISTSYGLRSWIRAGVPRSKLIMGLPLYGKTWQLRDPAVHGIGAPAVGLGPGDLGILTYAQVTNFNRENNATVVYDVATVSTYSIAGNIWVGYDDSRSTAVKVVYARALGLRGYFFWAANGDQQWEISKTASSFWRN